MSGKTVLVAGASGLVGYAAVKHFAAEPGCRVIALSRRRPPHDCGATFLAADLTGPAACEALAPALAEVTHLVFAALFELPDLVAGWRDAEQIAVNGRMFANLLAVLRRAAPRLRHVSLLQGTKAYGVHVRPIPIPAREGRDELRTQPNFYWVQEDHLRAAQHGQDWGFTIFRPVLIVGDTLGGAMSLIPAIGTWAACRRAAGETTLPFPGGVARVAQAVDADLLARAIAWAGEAATARNETFNVTNGDVFTWPAVWPAIAAALGMARGEPAPLSLVEAMADKAAAWDCIRADHALAAPALDAFVGLSFQYADYTWGYGRTEPGPPAIVSTVKIQQAGFHETMDTEAMFRKWFEHFRQERFLPHA